MESQPTQVAIGFGKGYGQAGIALLGYIGLGKGYGPSIALLGNIT